MTEKGLYVIWACLAVSIGHCRWHESAVRDFAEEGLEVLKDDSVEQGVFGVAGLIRAGRMGHAMASRGPQATLMPSDQYTGGMSS